MMLPDEIGALGTMDRASLCVMWQTCFGGPVPSSTSLPLMRHLLAWEIQSKRTGTSAERMQRHLQRSRYSNIPPKLAVGSRLLREWQGQTHVITFSASGYEYAGKQWRSLSAIARAITGTSWSGPAFFGLKAGKAS